jgi:hypothetical protein
LAERQQLFASNTASKCTVFSLQPIYLSSYVWLSGIRWAVERCFEETKTELAMDQYEVRKFAGWNHHMLPSMPAHFFLWHLKIRLVEKAPAITLSQLSPLIVKFVQKWQKNLVSVHVTTQVVRFTVHGLRFRD